MGELGGVCSGSEGATIMPPNNAEVFSGKEPVAAATLSGADDATALAAVTLTNADVLTPDA